ncbi:39S ribosomal protein S30, mitochondrial [Cololabis saira]|uniref:39S ribosomal protein S30, mitochondrial n=1 Tax=Cololabis saira TaxID=129043 RepID=UPI002AD3C945|nr:39S ribosomal protein S30, mitochondrial [Cololabis saira]
MAARARLPLLLPKHVPAFRTQRFVQADAAVKQPNYPPVVASLTAKSRAARQRRMEERISVVRSAAGPDKLAMVTSLQRSKFVLYPQTAARRADQWYQHFTKTAYTPGLPDRVTVETGVEEEQLAELRALVTRVILHQHWYLKQKRSPFMFRHQEQLVGPFLQNLVKELTHSLAQQNPLLRSCSLDVSPQVNFYWRRGQRIIPKGHRRGREEPHRFQIDDQPHSQIRITQQLPQFAPLESSYAAEVPEVRYAPNMMPLFRRQYKNNIFTGAKMPDPACYGHTQFHLVPDRYHRDRFARLQQSEQVEVFLRANALASLFAWTGAQAMYQGFWNHEDVSRPFTSQAVITDGHFFSFFCYQLNTVALSVETDANIPRKNLLWGTESQRLYDSVQDGEVVGLNDDVLKLLVQFLLNQP